MELNSWLPRTDELVDIPVDAGERVAHVVEWADPAKNGVNAVRRPYVGDGWENGYVSERASCPCC